MHLAPSSDLQQMPVDLDPRVFERAFDALGEGLKVARSKREDSGSCAREADTEEAWMGDGCVGGEDEGEAGDLGGR